MNFHLPIGLGVQETELNEQTKHCSAKHEKQIKVSIYTWQWAECIMVDVCMKLHKRRSLGVR